MSATPPRWEEFRRSFSSAGSRIRFNVRAALAGCERKCESTYDWHGLRRGTDPFLLWQYTLAGRGELHYEGRRYQLLPEQAMVVRIPHDHRYFLPSDSAEWKFIFVILTGVESVRLGRQLIEQAGPVFDYRGRDSERERILTAFAELVASGNHPAEHSLRAYRLLMELAEFAAAAAPGSGRTPAVERAVRYALHHYAEPIGVAELGGAARLSRYHFSRRFRQETGSSPAEFILQLRLEQAELLLRSSELPVRQIGEECGFSSHSCFCRAFRRRFGCAPGRFRGN